MVEYDPGTHDLKTLSLHYFEEPELKVGPCVPAVGVSTFLFPLQHGGSFGGCSVATTSPVASCPLSAVSSVLLPIPTALPSAPEGWV